MTKWTYGDAWEKFPIEPGEVWGVPANGSKVAVHNIFDPLPDFMLTADLVFVDPPWNLGNINAFYTKAGRSDYLQSFDTFADVLFQRLVEISAHTTYIEIGRQNVKSFLRRLEKIYLCVQTWEVTYYKKHPTFIIRGSDRPIGFNFNSIDEAKCIELIAEIERYDIIGDLCMGRGLVGLAAYRAGRPFVGTELNKRRLACLLAGLKKLGADVRRYGEENGRNSNESE